MPLKWKIDWEEAVDTLPTTILADEVEEAMELAKKYVAENHYQGTFCLHYLEWWGDFTNLTWEFKYGKFDEDDYEGMYDPYECPKPKRRKL